MENFNPLNYKENDYFFDIENIEGGEINCISLVSENTEDIHFLSTFHVDEMEVSKKLLDPVWLKQNTGSSKDVEPIKGRLYITYFNNESEMLQGFKTLVDSLQVSNLVAWNSEFDKTQIEERGKLYNIYGIFETVTVFDIMQAFSLLDDNDSYRGRAALKFSCLDKLGYTKIENNGEKISIDILGYQQSNPNLLAIYNIWDSIIIRRLNDAMSNIIQFYRTHSDFVSCSIEDFYNNIKMNETLIMHRAKLKNIVIQSKEWIVYKGGIEGGFVMDPFAGLLEKCFELDLTKAYPTTIIEGNLSNETYVEEPFTVCKKGEQCKKYIENLDKTHCWKCKKFCWDVPHIRVPSGRIYRTDFVGIFPEILIEMKNNRIRYQKEYKQIITKIAQLEKEGKYEEADVLKPLAQQKYRQQFVMKNISNSFYGVWASAKFRLSNSEIAADVTWIVRNLVKWNVENINRLRLEYEGVPVQTKAIYSDTDGVKVAILNISEIEKKIGHPMVESDVRKIAVMYETWLNNSYPDFSEQTFGSRGADFEVKVENVYEALYIWGAKKNYIYKKFPDGDRPSVIIKVGIKRSDRNNIFKMLTDKVGDLILKNRINDIGKVLIEIETDLLSGKFDNDLGRPSGVTSENNHFLESMLHSNEIFGKNFKIGDKPVFYKCIGIKGKKLPKNGIVALEYSDHPADFGLILDKDLALNDLKKSVEGFLGPLGGWDKLKNQLIRKKVTDLW